MKKNPRAIDLFSGAGGLTEGLRQAGYHVVGAVEIDPLACKAYRSNHRRTKLWETDIRLLTGPAMLSELRMKRGQLDLLAACPPCQGFSRVRTRNGTQRNRDPRNELIFDVLRLIRSIRPKAIMIENVPRLANDKRYREFLEKIALLGYKARWGVLDAVDFGVPQRRQRLVLLAALDCEPRFADKARTTRSVRQAIGKLTSPRRSRDALHNYPVERSEKVRRIISRIPRNGGSRSALGEAAQLDCHKRIEGFWDVYGRMAWDLPSPTITGGCINPSKGRFLHPHANRAITLREAALLQTFPKRYRFPIEGGRYPVALLIGNALPPELIRRHALALRNCLGAVRRR